MRRVALLCVAAAGVAARVDVDLSFGWRFRAGASQGGCNPADFTPSGLNNRQVFGLSNAPSATDAPSCLAAACAANAELFQWCPAGAGCGSASCWIGVYPGTSSPGTGWVSGLSNVSDIANAPETQAAYADAAWTVVDLPHDMLVNGTYSSSANGGEAYLPFGVGFYRKHLVVPAAWSGTRVDLYVEAALSTSQWWLNGVPLGGTFQSGYTAFAIRLDNVPGVVWGGANVLVAFVDAESVRTGWWYGA